jgi:hypothetical protein
MREHDEPFIDWETVPKVGVPVIGFEHKQLVVLINRLYQSVASGVVSKTAVWKGRSKFHPKMLVMSGSVRLLLLNLPPTTLPDMAA